MSAAFSFSMEQKKRQTFRFDVFFWLYTKFV